MKKSIAYLPEQKQHELKYLVECVLEFLPDCEMIILYGSYARGTYVDYDQRVEYGVRTCYMSDYDILVVTNDGFSDYIISNILDKARARFHHTYNIHVTPNVEFINESINGLNKAIDKGRYFYTDIKKDGVLLYDSGRYKLARRRKQNYQEIKALAEEYFEEKFTSANEFLLGAKFFMEQDLYKKSSFLLHQACENYYSSIILVYALYSAKDHNLKSLSGKAKAHSLESASAFPRNSEDEERLFKLLLDAYVQARYNPQFVVPKEDIEMLFPKVELLRDLTKRCCEERIAEYESHIRNKK